MTNKDELKKIAFDVLRTCRTAKELNDIGNVIEALLITLNEDEAQLKAKDEQIAELNHTISGLNEMYIELKE